MTKSELSEITAILKGLLVVIEKHDQGIYDRQNAGFPKFVQWDDLDLSFERVKAAIGMLEKPAKPAPLNEKAWSVPMSPIMPDIMP